MHFNDFPSHIDDRHDLTDQVVSRPKKKRDRRGSFAYASPRSNMIEMFVCFLVFSGKTQGKRCRWSWPFVWAGPNGALMRPHYATMKLICMALGTPWRPANGAIVRPKTTSTSLLLFFATLVFHSSIRFCFFFHFFLFPSRKPPKSRTSNPHFNNNNNNNERKKRKENETGRIRDDIDAEP